MTYAAATSVEVERVFSRGRLLISHTRNGLSPQSTRAVLCLGQWSKLGLIDDGDLEAVSRLPEVDEDDLDVEVVDLSDPRKELNDSEEESSG